MTQTLWPDPRTKKNQGCRRSWRCLLFGWEFLSSAWHVWDSRCQADLRRNLEVARKHRIAREKLQALHKIKGCEMTLQAHCKELANCVSNSHELNLKMCVGAFVAPIQAQLNKAKVQEHAADSTEALFWISFACWFPLSWDGEQEIWNFKVLFILYPFMTFWLPIFVSLFLSCSFELSFLVLARSNHFRIQLSTWFVSKHSKPGEKDEIVAGRGGAAKSGGANDEDTASHQCRSNVWATIGYAVMYELGQALKKNSLQFHHTN